MRDGLIRSPVQVCHFLLLVTLDFITFHKTWHTRARKEPLARRSLESVDMVSHGKANVALIGDIKIIPGGGVNPAPQEHRYPPLYHKASSYCKHW